jgi:hypothetical protein
MQSIDIKPTLIYGMPNKTLTYKIGEINKSKPKLIVIVH